MTEADQLALLREYSDGQRGTRDTIEALGLRDYGDLIVALAEADLPFPKPPDTPQLRRHRAAAWAILEPRLRRGP